MVINTPGSFCVAALHSPLGRPWLPSPPSFVACFLMSATMEVEQVSSVPSMSILVAVPCSPRCQQVRNSDTRSWRLRFREESSALRSGAQHSGFPKKTAQPPASREPRRPQRGPASLRRPSAPAPPARCRARPGWAGGSSMLRFPFPVSASEGWGQWGCSSCWC